MSDFKMTAIAQTLDGTVAFETKEELFDYVCSELFGFKYSLYLKLADIWDLL